jgi:hypothetical protein
MFGILRLGSLPIRIRILPYFCKSYDLLPLTDNWFCLFFWVAGMPFQIAEGNKWKKNIFAEM